jgi:WD40 repeat protein
MKRGNLISKIMFIALATATAFPMADTPLSSDSQTSIVASSSTGSDEIKTVTLHGTDYSIKNVSIEVAKVSQRIAYNVSKLQSKDPLEVAAVSHWIAYDDIKNNGTETEQCKSVTIKIPSQISEETLRKLIKIMEQVAELQKQGGDERDIILQIYIKNWKDYLDKNFKGKNDNLDVILAAYDLGCSYIFKTLVLAYKCRGPVSDVIPSYPYIQALKEIRAKYFSTKLKHIDDYFDGIVPVEAMSGLKIADTNSQNTPMLVQRPHAEPKNINDDSDDDGFDPVVEDVIVGGMAKLTIDDLNRSVEDANSQKPDYFSQEFFVNYKGGIAPPSRQLTELIKKSICCLMGLKNLYLIRIRQHEIVWAEFSSNHKLFVTAGDCAAKLWNTQDGQWRCTLSGHKGYLHGVIFSPDCNLLATFSEDCTARLWDTDGNCKHILSEHKGAVTSATFSPNGNLLATTSDDGTAKIWNTQSGECVRTLLGHGSDVSSVKFSHDGKRVATGSRDRTAKIWNIEDGKCLHTFGQLVQDKDLVNSYKEGWVFHVEFSPDDKLLATGADNGIVKLWNTESGEFISTFAGHGNNIIHSILFSHDSKLLVTTSHNTVKIWKITDGDCIQAWSGPVDCDIVNSNGRLCIVAGSFSNDIVEAKCLIAMLSTLLNPDETLILDVVRNKSNLLNEVTKIWDAKIADELSAEQLILVFNLHNYSAKNTKVKLNPAWHRVWESEGLPQSVKDYYQDVVA